MLPLDPDLLIFVKFFVVFTCVCFWVRVGMDLLFRHHRVDGRRLYE
jgi:hypothetical protein